MASKDNTPKTGGTMQQPLTTPSRVEDEKALRDALLHASLRVKRLAQMETESESAGEEILHFRLRGDR
jgi:hypothetical protein